ncbi:MAG: dienelactone hydrolase family protein [Acholeplasmataceae bacterium]
MKSLLKKYNKYNKIHKSAFILTILVLIIFLTSLFAGLVQTDFGSIEIETQYLDTRDNQVLVYDIYIPDSATEENKAPAVVVIAGFQRTRETQSHVAIELARRGFVVLNIDPYSQGDSTSSSAVQGSAIATVEGYGAFDLIDYVYDNDDVYPFIDKDKIGVTGHSAGGNAAYQAAVYFGKDAVNNGGASKVNSVFISGYVLSIDSSISYAKSNMAMDYAFYDEGAFRNEVNVEAPEGTSKSDMTWAIESHDFINSGLSQSGLSSIGYDTQVEIGKIYGNPTLRTMRQVFNTEIIHAFQPYSLEATSNIINYFEISMDFYSDIDANNQVWQIKEVLTTVALICSLATLVPIASLLYAIPFFKKSQKDPIMTSSKRTKSQLAIYITIFILAATFAALTYLPSSQLSFDLFPDASNSIPTWFFPQRMTNAVMIWAVISGFFSLLLFIVGHFINQKIKKEKIPTKSWGLSISFENVMKTVLLGIIVIVLYFIILMIVYSIFHVDYRFIFIMSVRRVNLKTVLQLLMYFPLFFVFYFSNSIRVNGGQMDGKLPEWIKLILAGFMNIAGLAMLLLIQYISFSSTGTIAFTELADGTTQWLYINILFTLLPVMFLMPLFNRWFYKLSGNSYLGPIIICAIFVMIALSNSVAYIPN